MIETDSLLARHSLYYVVDFVFNYTSYVKLQSHVEYEKKSTLHGLKNAEFWSENLKLKSRQMSHFDKFTN